MLASAGTDHLNVRTASSPHHIPSLRRYRPHAETLPSRLWVTGERAGEPLLKRSERSVLGVFLVSRLSSSWPPRPGRPTGVAARWLREPGPGGHSAGSGGYRGRRERTEDRRGRIVQAREISRPGVLAICRWRIGRIAGPRAPAALHAVAPPSPVLAWDADPRCQSGAGVLTYGLRIAPRARLLDSFFLLRPRGQLPLCAVLIGRRWAGLLEPQEIEDEGREQILERVAAVDVARAGRLCH
jgi:hypothetical protein